MPYIEPDDDRREALKNGDVAKSAGELNYQLFVYLRSLIEELPTGSIWNHSPDKARLLLHVQNFLGNIPNYQKYNDMAGVMILCTKEFKRRFGLKITELLAILDMYDNEIGNYENIKIELNGDAK